MKNLRIIIFILICFAQKTLSQTAGNALNFDGLNDGIVLNTVLLSNTNGNQSYTIEAWVKTTNGNDICIVCQYDYPGQNRFQFEIRGDKLNWWKGLHPTDASNNSILTTQSINDGQWHHVAATRDASGNVLLYIDGIQDGSGVDTLAFLNTNTSIGERTLGNDGSFEGDMDEVRIWNLVRSQGDIQSTMNQELIGTESGLIAYYNFNQGIPGGDNTSITILNDSTSNGYNGTIADFTLNGATSNFILSTITLSNSVLEFQPKISAYPNPTEAKLQFHFSNNLTIEFLKVYNLSGQLVKLIENEEVNSIDLSNLSNGIYFIYLIDSNLNSTTFKIIKK
jgi:hypothetical protein